MNNSKIVLDANSLGLEEKATNIEALRERETQLVRIIEALEGISHSTEWSTLKTLIFDSLVDSLERQVKYESERKNLDDSEIYRLQGKLSWARKYASLSKLSDEYRLELSNIRKLYE